MTRPRVSVLIPCYNAENFVGEAIDSALNQTWKNVEVVVVDDGSTDNSVDILKSYGERIVFEAGPNRGACAARNRAFELSSGDLIQFLDADDKLCLDKLERQVQILASADYDATFSHGYLFGDGGPLRKKKSRIASPEGQDPFVYCLHQGLATPGPLIRRELVEKVGGFRDGLRRGQEWDFHVRLAAAGMRLHYLPEYLYCVRNDGRGERITNLKLPHDYFLQQLIILAEWMENGPEYQLTASRKIVLASYLHMVSSGVFREGGRTMAAAGFATAHRIADGDQKYFHGSSLFRVVCRLLGPMKAEEIRRLLLRLRKSDEKSK